MWKQMPLLFLIPFIIYPSNSYLNFIHNDHFQEYGLASHKIFVKSIDAYYVAKSDLCDGWSSSNWDCDYFLPVRSCIFTNMSYKSSITEYQSKLITIQESDLSPIPEKILGPDAKCSGVNIIEFPRDYTEIYYSYQTMLLVDKLDGKFQRRFHVSGYVQDGNEDGSLIVLWGFVMLLTLELTGLRPRSLIKPWDAVFHQTARPYMIQGDAYMEMVASVKCQPDYYGSTCWHFCPNNTRQECLCPQPITDACNVICRRGWKSVTIVVMIEDQSYSVNICPIIDRCIDMICSELYHECIVVSNTTAYCVPIEVQLLSQYNPLGEDFRVYFSSEVIVAVPRYSWFNITDTLEFGPWHIAVCLVTDGVSDGIFSEVDLQVYSQHYDAGISVMEVAEQPRLIDRYYRMNFSVTLEPWHLLIYRNISVRFYVMPDDIAIYGDAFRTRIFLRVYSGETILCNHSGGPMYRTLILWRANIINISRPYYSSLVITNVRGGGLFITGYIQCHVFMFIETLRHHLHSYTQINVHHRPYVFFKWSSQANVLPSNLVMQCLVQTYDRPYTQVIYQLDGLVKIEADIHYRIPLDHILSGLYRFICIYGNHRSFSRYITTEFSVTSKPTYACLMLHTTTYGSLVQCSHDGKFHDDYFISMSLYSPILGDIVQQHDHAFIRIPYYGDLNNAQLVIMCSVTNINLFEVIISITENFLINRDSSGTYVMDENTRKCPLTQSFVELPHIIYINGNRVTMSHEIFFLDKNYHYNPEINGVIAVCFLMVITGSSIASLCVINKLFVKTKEDMQNNIAFSKRRVNRIHLCKSITSVANMILESQKKKLFPCLKIPSGSYRLSDQSLEARWIIK